MQFLKGKTSISELQEMPFPLFHTLYWVAWQESVRRAEQADNLDEKLEELQDEM